MSTLLIHADGRRTREEHPINPAAQVFILPDFDRPTDAGRYTERLFYARRVLFPPGFIGPMETTADLVDITGATHRGRPLHWRPLRGHAWVALYFVEDGAPDLDLLGWYDDGKGNDGDDPEDTDPLDGMDIVEQG